MAPKRDGAESRAAAASFAKSRIEPLVRKVTGRDEGGIRVNGIDDVLVRYAKCCNPLPGDEIIGFITRGRGVTVHRRDCPKAFDTDPERRVEISWDAQGEDQPPGAARGHDREPPGHSRDRRPDVQRAGHQHQRGELPRRRRRPAPQHLHVPLLRPRAAEERDEGARAVNGVVGVERV